MQYISIDQQLFFPGVNLNRACVCSSNVHPKWIAINGGYFLNASYSQSKVKRIFRVKSISTLSRVTEGSQVNMLARVSLIY